MSVFNRLIAEMAEASLDWVRNGPTSLAIIACSSAARAAGFGPSRLTALRSRSSAGRDVPRDQRDVACNARRAALRPARAPNASASVIALPDKRLAPLAPPTASPQAYRPGTRVSSI